MHLAIIAKLIRLGFGNYCQYTNIGKVGIWQKSIQIGNLPNCYGEHFAVIAKTNVKYLATLVKRIVVLDHSINADKNIAIQSILLCCIRFKLVSQ